MAKGTKTEQKSKKETKSEVSTSQVVRGKMERFEIVREWIKEAQSRIETGYLDLCKLMSEAYHNDYHQQWGFDTFTDYAEKELDMKLRKAEYFVNIYDTVKKLQLPEAEVKELGWTKMKDLVRVITEENAKEWLKKAKKMSSRELTDAVKVSTRSDTSRVQPPKVTTLKFVMGEVEASIIMDALNEAKAMVESDDPVIALEMICQDWLSEKGVAPSLTSIDKQVAFIEKVYGVKIEWTPAESAPKEEKEAKNGADEGPEDEVSIDELLGLEGE